MYNLERKCLLGLLAVLHQKLDNDGEQSGEEDKNAMDKIKELVKLSDKSTQWAAEIPDILDRMEALSPLHTEVPVQYIYQYRLCTSIVHVLVYYMHQ